MKSCLTNVCNPFASLPSLVEAEVGGTLSSSEDFVRRHGSKLKKLTIVHFNIENKWKGRLLDYCSNLVLLSLSGDEPVSTSTLWTSMCFSFFVLVKPNPFPLISPGKRNKSLICIEIQKRIKCVHTYCNRYEISQNNSEAKSKNVKWEKVLRVVDTTGVESFNKITCNMFDWPQSEWVTLTFVTFRNNNHCDIRDQAKKCPWVKHAKVLNARFGLSLFDRNNTRFARFWFRVFFFAPLSSGSQLNNQTVTVPTSSCYDFMQNIMSLCLLIIFLQSSS